jgi:DMSO/TMAO reductase YedYZ molybdopterin-dependent catalytic subunit
VPLPPGQHAIDGFPRFGTHLADPAPLVPSEPTIELSGPVEPLVLPLDELRSLPRREITADFHCVSGWSATGLRWEGVAFETFYRSVIEPVLSPGATITHVVFAGLDGYRSVVTLEDALDPDVLIAENLDGQPLDSDTARLCDLSARANTASSARSTSAASSCTSPRPTRTSDTPTPPRKSG